jgi:hypothetical protein
LLKRWHRGFEEWLDQLHRCFRFSRDHAAAPNMLLTADRGPRNAFAEPDGWNFAAGYHLVKRPRGKSYPSRCIPKTRRR